MTARQIVPGAYSISLGSVNAFLIEYEESLTLVDTGSPGSFELIRSAVRSLGRRMSDIQHLLVTHCHADHTGSLSEIKEVSGAEAYMHALDADLVRIGQSYRPLKTAPGLLAGILGNVILRSAQEMKIQAAEIEHEVADGAVLPIAGGIQAIHTPGHAAGHLAFLWPRHSGVLFAGDAASSILGLRPALVYEDFQEGLRSLRKLSAYSFKTACFGHGRAIGGDAGRRFLQQWRGQAR